MFQVLFYLIGYYTARVVLPLISMGWVRADDLSSRTPGGWRGFHRDRSRRFIVTSALAGEIGVAFWFLVLAGIVIAFGR